MKSPAELFVESLTLWPEPMPSDNLTSYDWLDVASIYSNINVENAAANVGLSLISVIESQGLTIDNFRGNEGLFIFAFNSLLETQDLGRIEKFHRLHGKSIADCYNNDPNQDRVKQAEFFRNIFTPKEA